MDILLRYVLRELRRFGAIHSEPRHLQTLFSGLGWKAIPTFSQGIGQDAETLYSTNAAPHTRPDVLVCEYNRMFRHNRHRNERFLPIL